MRASRSISRTFSAVGITSGSFWNPSRGPTSRIDAPCPECSLRGMSGPVVLLAGGTGGAKLARGLLDVVGADLIVIANTGDDVEIHGGHVSPDPTSSRSGWPTRSTSAAGACATTRSP